MSNATVAVPALAHTPAPAGRSAVRSLALARVLRAGPLPTPPAVAMQIVKATSNPDCEVKEIVGLLAHDPAICGQLLKVINSCVYALSSPITSVERAVLLLGLNTVRSLVLALSLPAMQSGGVPAKDLRDYWIGSVSGAIMAKELATRLRRPMAEDDLVCGLLRDLGGLLLRQAFPDEYADFALTARERTPQSVCAAERGIFGVDHADVTAELLTEWKLPATLIDPIRGHHHPDELVNPSKTAKDRAELLCFVESLTQLDAVAQHPDQLAALLHTAEHKFKLPQGELVQFLQDLVPKVSAFAELLSLDVSSNPEFVGTLTRGCAALVQLSSPASTAAGSGARTVAASGPNTPLPAPSNLPPMVGPAFQAEFVTKFPHGGCHLDGLQLQRVLGKGAMGIVFLGHDPGLDRAVAVKMMDPEVARDPQNRARFAREAKSVAAVAHDNVVRIYAVREVDGLPYIAMEFLEGVSFEEKLARGKLPVAEVCGAAEQIAAGLNAAHARGIIHRDLKPANVLVDKTGRVKLVDFGLARKDNDASVSTSGCIVGTPLYMSPEQVYGEELDARTDLFSLGTVLTMLATGKNPFDAPSTVAVMKKVADLEPPPLRQVRSDAPEWLEKLVRKLLAKKRNERFASADDVLAYIRMQPPPAAAAAKPEAKKKGWFGW